LENNGLVVIDVNVGYLFVVNERLKNAPSYEVFLE
jgi:hypothetical protein